MKKDKLIQVRITTLQYQKFNRFAELNDMSKSEIIREFINKLINKLKKLELSVNRGN